MTEHEEVLRQLHAAAASPEPRANARAVAQQALNDDLSSDTVYGLLLQVHQSDLPEAVVEQLEDVMDLVWGWCSPSTRLRKQSPEQADVKRQ